ncbi:hypothetical protein [Jatrophihabitans fulvus]
MTATSDPAASAYPGPQVGGPPPPPAHTGPKVAATWTGILLALGGLAAAIGAFLPYEKISDGEGATYQFTGLGSEKVTGGVDADLLTPGNAGKVVLVAGIVALVLGLLVLARKGRIWVGIVAVVVGAIGALLAFASLGAPKNDADKLGEGLTGSVGIGAVLGTIGMVVALVAGILAIVVRRRSV